MTQSAIVRDVESYDTDIEAGPTDSVGTMSNGQVSEKEFIPQIMHIFEFHCSVFLNLLLFIVSSFLLTSNYGICPKISLDSFFS